MSTRTPYFSVSYNNEEFKSGLASGVVSVSYDFRLSGGANTCNLTLDNSKGEFFDDLYPKKGDTFSLVIGYSDSTDPLFCGDFEIDETSYDLANHTVTLRGTSTAIAKNFYETQYRSYAGTLKKVVNEVASRNNLTVEGEIGELELGKKSQSNSDLEFLQELADLFGYVVRIEDNVLYFYKWETLRDKASNPDFTIKAEKLLDGSLLNDSGRTYQYCEATYFRKGVKFQKKVEDTYNANGLILKIETRSETDAQSESEAKAALTQANLDAITGVFVFEGNTLVNSGSVIELKGAGQLSGCYAVKKGTHSIQNGDDAFLTTVEVFAL
ncbi:hypothetical protein IKS86_04420 [bacterium]|nr:hypothetical protein [bacterium]